MGIEINNDVSNIKIWTEHPLAIHAKRTLPKKVLSKLHPEFKTSKFVMIESLPTDALSIFIDHKATEMKTALSSHQSTNNVITLILAFLVGGVFWMTTSKLSGGVPLNVSLGVLGVITMVFIIVRRFIKVSNQSSALYDLYIYLIKEHEFMYSKLHLNTIEENEKLNSEITKLTLALKKQTKELTTTISNRDECIRSLEGQVDYYIESLQGVVVAYNDLLQHVHEDIIEEHLYRCSEHGIDVVLEDEVPPLVMQSNSIH